MGSWALAWLAPVELVASGRLAIFKEAFDETTASQPKFERSPFAGA
jgi:hypothetical protein